MNAISCSKCKRPAVSAATRVIHYDPNVVPQAEDTFAFSACCDAPLMVRLSRAG